MKRAADSHKGENGKIAVIGGAQTIHGAPIFSALAAEAAGVDTVSICLPRCHSEAAKSWTLNAFVHPFAADDLRQKDVGFLLELTATIDVAVIGPGIARESESVRALEDIVAAATCKLVLDATALQPWTLDRVHGKAAVLTPHLGELERMGVSPNEIGDVARGTGTTVVLKGMIDRIAHPDGTVEEIRGGNAGLTVGGTGDALAGLIAGLMAQGMEIADAARMGCAVMKRAAEELWPEYGFSYGTQRVIKRIPRLLATLDA